MSDLIMLVGVSYSGKSFYAELLAKQTGAVIVSSDAIRGELWGDENDSAIPQRYLKQFIPVSITFLRKGRT